ncbi:hypothetical protein KAI87_16845 [Myxococcota bacterium]|nr:hypothetical protein [Myxococcota bacterium]
MKNLFFVFVMSVVIAGLAMPVAAKVAKPRLVVMDLVSEQGLKDGTVRLLNELLLNEFSKTDRYHVIGGSDIKAMLAHESERAMMGCSDVSCLVELGGALGADLLATASVGRIGKLFLVNLKILNIHKAEVVARWSEQVEGGEEALLPVISKCVAEVTRAKQGTHSDSGKAVSKTGSDSPPSDSAKATPKTNSEPAPSLAQNVEPAGDGVSVSPLPLALWGAGAVAIGVGGYFGMEARAINQKIEDEELGAQNDVQDGLDAMRNANILYGIGVVSIGAGVALWLLDDPKDDAKLSLVPLISATQNGFALTGAF